MKPELTGRHLTQLLMWVTCIFKMVKKNLKVITATCKFNFLVQDLNCPLVNVFQKHCYNYCTWREFYFSIKTVFLKWSEILLLLKEWKRYIVITIGTHQIKLEHFAWLGLSNKEDFLLCFLIGESNESL